MSSFFTIPGQGKRKRPSGPEAPSKKTTTSVSRKPTAAPRRPAPKSRQQPAKATPQSKKAKQDHENDDEDSISGSSDSESPFEGLSDPLRDGEALTSGSDD